MTKRFQQLLHKVNVVRHVCHFLFGKDCRYSHRMLVGLVVMLSGVAVAKTAGHHELIVIALIGDGIGYALHGLGLTPYLEWLIEATAATEE